MANVKAQKETTQAPVDEFENMTREEAIAAARRWKEQWNKTNANLAQVAEYNRQTIAQFSKILLNNSRQLHGLAEACELFVGGDPNAN